MNAPTKAALLPLAATLLAGLMGMLALHAHPVPDPAQRTAYQRPFCLQKDADVALPCIEITHEDIEI